MKLDVQESPDSLLSKKQTAFEEQNQIIFAYHLYGEGGAIHLCQEELVAYKEVPIEKLRPWGRGTGPALQDWLASRGYYPPLLRKTSPVKNKT